MRSEALVCLVYDMRKSVSIDSNARSTLSALLDDSLERNAVRNCDHSRQ